MFTISKYFLLFFLFFSTLLGAESLQNAKVPKDTQSDWMELKSGEWVRGTFKGVTAGHVSFDSEKFKLVSFDLDDVKQIVTHRKSTINLSRNLRSLNPLKALDISDHEISGRLSFKDGKFFMLLADGSVQSLPQESVSSIASGELNEKSYWSGGFFIGIDVMSGNTEQASINSKANLERKTFISRFRVDYIGKFSEHDNNVTTADNDTVTSSLDFYLTEHLYWRFIAFEYMSDVFKNITTKYTYSTGIGYDIIYTKDSDWSVTIGPGYQRVEYENVLQGEDNRVETALLFLDTRFTQKIVTDVTLLINYTMYLVNHKSGDYVHHSEVTLKSKIISDFTFNASLFWDRTASPRAFDSGDKPGKDDFKTMIALGYSF